MNNIIIKYKIPITISLLVILSIVLFFVFRNNSSSSNDNNPIIPKNKSDPRWITQNSINYPIIHYLSVLYPLVDTNMWNKMSDQDIINFYLNLNWFYLPLVYPLPSDWYDYSKQIGTWKNGLNITPTSKFLYWPSLGFDLGDYGIALSGSLRGLNVFGCSVFGGKSTWHSEWNKNDHGKVYQNLSFIKPWSSQRYGVPNYSYIETQTYVCEEIGRATMSAPACSNVPPLIQEMIQDYCKDNKCYKDSPKITGCDDTMYWCPGKPQPGMPKANMIDKERSYAEDVEYYTKPVCVSPPNVSCITNTTDWSKPDASCVMPDGSFWNPRQCPAGSLAYAGDTIITCLDFNTGLEGKDRSGKPICQSMGGAATSYCSYEANKYIKGNVCSTPLSLWNCSVDNGCEFNIKGVPWDKYLQSQEKSLGAIGSSSRAYKVKQIFQTTIFGSQPSIIGNSKSKYSSNCSKLSNGVSCAPNQPPSDNNIISPNVNLATPGKFMAYWMKGYGKFCNMGKTGVYYSFVHFLLTCPKTFPGDGPGGPSIKGAPARSNPIQILAAQGNSQYMSQLTALSSGVYTDPRQTIQGFVTLFRKGQNGGLFEELSGGQDIPNKLPFQTQNVNGVLNPLDDDFLKTVDKLTVGKYYPTPVKNPNYGKKVALTPYKALILFMAMNLNGDTGADCPGDLLNPNVPNYCSVSVGSQPPPSKKAPFINGNGVYPFGLYFPGSNIGSSCYAIAYNLGWDSLQLTQMPTGAGRTQYCTTCIADYELVFLRSTQDTCKNYYFTVDISKDINNYLKNGYIQGSTSGSTYDDNVNKDKKNGLIKNIDPTVMPLTERNMPDGSSPNTWYYPDASTPVQATITCPYKDKIVSELK
jgi:hypothetical protein